MLQAVEGAIEKVDNAHSNEPSAPLKPSRWQYDVARISIAILIVAALIAAGFWLNRPLKRLGPPQKCWEQKEIDGKLYNVNPCTGQIKLIGELTPAAGESPKRQVIGVRPSEPSRLAELSKPAEPSKPPAALHHFESGFDLLWVRRRVA